MLNTILPKLHYKQTASLLANGDFSSNNLRGWTAAAGWSAGTGEAVHSAGVGDTTPLVQAVNLITGTTYGVSVIASGRTAGTLTLTLGALAGSYSVGTDGTYWQTFLATSSASFNLTFTPSANFDGAVGEITVRPQGAVSPEYPNLDDRFDGTLVPIRIGDIHNIVPVCIDTAAQIYQICGHPIHAVTEVREAKEGKVLTITTDYTLNADKNEITFRATPLLTANTTYYFVIEADYDVGAAHLHFFYKNSYGNGQFYSIDGADAWTADATKDLRFRIYGKESLGGTEAVMVNNGYAPNTGNIGLRDVAGRTRIAQSFKTPASTAFYITRVQVFCSKAGAPAGNVRIAILSAYTPAEAQAGIKSDNIAIPSGRKTPRFITFPQRATDSGLLVDIEGAEEVGGGGVPITTVAEALKYLTQTVLGKPATLLDATYLADLATDRTQAVKVNLDYETTAGAVIGTLETGQLWKLVPLLDGTYGTVVYETGEPANTPHFRDEDYLSFRMWLDYSAVKSKVVIKYDKGAGDAQEFKTEQVSSDLARFFYLNEETLEVETMLRESAGAAWLAGELGSMYEQPPLMVEFEVHGYGLDLIPGRDKVKLTRTRAMYASGTLSAVLFRILRLQKRPGTSTTVILAILDTQSY